MTDLPPHKKRILLVEDRQDFYDPIRRWLEDEGYDVTLAKTLAEALTAVDTHHFHLAVIDIRLVDDDPGDESGMELLAEIERRGLSDVMPCIMLTANENVNNILMALQERHAARYIQKIPGYRGKLLAAVHELFADKIKINFELEYDVNSDELIAEIAADIHWSIGGKPDLARLMAQVRDLFGKLFHDAQRVHIAKLKPGLTGAAIIRVEPTWRHGMGTRYVVKIGRRNKAEVEAQRFDEFVSRFLPPNTIAQIKDVAYTQELGALQYTFTENERVPLREFDEYYQEQDAAAIVRSLQNLFDNTCRHWYEAPRRGVEDLPALYYEAFQLDEAKLIQRIQVVLPAFDPTAVTFHVEQPAIDAVNPIAWLNEHRHEYVQRTFRCITHGDMTGRNIMVDHHGKCWLIDFYRTYDSHILRDFVILETDVKYRLMGDVELQTFLKLEQALLSVDEQGKDDTLNMKMPATVRKAFNVINAMRALAYEYAGGVRAPFQESRKEYLISLLMTTLNVVRLRHIGEARKVQAMLSAALICAELDEIAGRPAHRPEMASEPDQSQIATVISSRPGTAQQRFLADLVDARQLILFVGSDDPESLNAGGAIDKLVQIPWRIVYTTNRDDFLEKSYGRSPTNYVATTSPPKALTVNDDEAVIGKIYGSVHETMGHRSDDGEDAPRSHRFLRQMREALQEGMALLVLCASRSELMMVRDACYQADARGLIWVTGPEFAEDEQDEYRRLGLRVLPDSPQALLAMLYRLTVY